MSQLPRLMMTTDDDVDASATAANGDGGEF